MTLIKGTLSAVEIIALRHDTLGTAKRVHLDNCGSSLMPKQVIDCVTAHISLEAQFGGYVAQEQQSGALSAVYDSAAKLIKGDSDDIAITASAVDAWTKAFYSIPMSAHDNIVTSFSEYCSNYVAFLHRQKRDGVEIRVARATAEGQLDLDHLESLIDKRTRLISLTHVPSSSGVVLPAAAVGEIARRHDILYLLDTCQSIGHVPVNVQEVGCDMATGTGRKFLRGPRGIGFLYVNERARQHMDPVVMTNQAAAWVARDKYDQRRDAKLFEGWERNTANQLGFGAAIDYLLKLGLERATDQILENAASLRQQLSGLKGVTVTCPDCAHAAIITFNKAGFTAAEIKALLEKQDIAVQVASVVHTRLDLEERGIDTAVRVSPHYFNTQSEFDIFLNALEAL